MAHKKYHAGNHRALGGVVVRAAYNNPDTICARCGKTYRQAVEAWGEQAAAWVRGHKVRATVARTSAEYQAEHARCSAQEGAQVRNARSSHGYDWP